MSDQVGVAYVEVRPDARNWSANLERQIRDKTVTVNADADTTEAEAQLDAAARPRSAKITADTSQLSKGANALDSFVGKLGLLPALAIAGTAAVIPLAGALGGVAAALAAPLAIAGGGATLFAVLAGFAVKDTNKQLKAIDSLQKKLDGLTKGTPAYRQAAQDLAAAQKALSPQQVAFSNAKDNLSGSFEKFIGGPAGVALLAPLTKGMGLLAQILPHLTPILTAASDAFSSLLGGVGDAVDSPGFDKFIHLVSGQVGHDIEGFGRILGSLATGLGGIFVTLDKSVGSSLVDQLVRLSGAFSDWANSKAGRQGIHDFLDYFHEVGPQVADTVSAVARGVGHLVEALAPLGPPVLRVIQGIADAISGIPTPVLTALLAGTAGTIAFQKLGGFKAAPGALRLGQNALSALTGGLVPGAGGKGIVPVYVTNPGFGGPGGGGGPIPAAGRALKRVGKYALPGLELGGEALTVGGLAGVLGTAVVAAVTTYGLGKVLQGESSPVTDTQHPNGSNLTPAQYRALNAREVHNEFPNTPELRSTTTVLDNIHAQAARASRSLDLVGAHAESMSRQTVRSIHNMTGTTGLDSVRAHSAAASRALELIGPHGENGARQAGAAARALATHVDAVHQQAANASRALEQFGPIAARSIHTAQNAADALNHHLDLVARRRTADVYLDDHGALARIASLQYAVDHLHGNTIVVKATGGHTVVGQATGGPVVGPGTGTSDSVPRMLSNGEYVVNARAAARNRAFLDQMNYGRSTFAPTSGGSRGMVHTTINLDGERIGEALTPYMADVANGEFHANRAYDYARAGQ